MSNSIEVNERDRVVENSMSFIGYPIFKKESHYEFLRLDDDAKSIDKNDGLCFVAHEPNLKFNYDALMEEINWNTLAVGAIQYSFHQLVKAQLISLQARVYSYSGFGRNLARKDYFFELVLNEGQAKDLMANEILSALKIVGAKKDKAIPMESVVAEIINAELGSDEFPKPAKKFALLLIERYANLCNDMKLERIGNNFVGATNYELQIENKRSIGLSRQLRSVITEINLMRQESTLYDHFIERLVRCSNEEFSARMPKDFDPFVD